MTATASSDPDARPLQACSDQNSQDQDSQYHESQDRESKDRESQDRESQPAQITRAARGTALNLAGAVIGAAVSFATVGLITNVYGKAGAGLFFAATAAFTLAANSARLGAESGLTYFVSRFRADQRHRAIPSLVRTAVVATGAAATALGLIGLVAAPQLSELLTDHVDSRNTATTMIRVLALAVPSFALSQAMFGASRGFGTMRPAVVAGQILRPVSQLILVAVVIVVTDDVWPLAVAWAVSSAITMVTIGGWLRRRLTKVADNGEADHRAADNAIPDNRQSDNGEADDGVADEEPDPVRSDRSRAIASREYWRFTGPRAVADLLSASLERLDILLVAIIVGEVGAGMYGASNRLILAGQLMMIATAQSMAPLLSANFLKGRHDDAQRVLRTISAWNVTLLWPVFICLAFGARTALSIFGSEFTDAAPLVVVLSMAFLVVIGLGIGDTLLAMTGDSLASLVNHAIALAVMIGVAVTLLPTVGIVGAAWAWALSRVTLRALAVGRVWQTKRVNAFGRPLLTAMAVAASAYVPIGLVSRAVFGETVAAVAVHVTAGAVVQLALLTRFRKQLELDQLLATITRRG
ncbi:MAG: lipopolysaccharide biosynthesis protein [Acidimicrobiales bacterium]